MEYTFFALICPVLIRVREMSLNKPSRYNQAFDFLQ